MKRSLLTILLVAAISGWISAGERAAGRSPGGDWVRTRDGWESRFVVEPHETTALPTIHPGVIAGLQLGASLFFLLAFPSQFRELAISRATAYFTERRRGGDRRQGADRRLSAAVSAG
ncbi:hypothetical protein [Lacipirellula parvula]|uniref:Uncharacterized protein n=1 Tax=Lacipirellula parvula TaxID=2650471 RepID=A0A5K7XJX7_9BACT|nr:hypothetical protein [Lacipirellula parvula]BBO36447.1 hypothetical protein PLANPX_6059 [Lacipirellula parvula]